MVVVELYHNTSRLSRVSGLFLPHRDQVHRTVPGDGHNAVASARFLARQAESWPASPEEHLAAALEA
jgi:hypothetical protein